MNGRNFLVLVCLLFSLPGCSSPQPAAQSSNRSDIPDTATVAPSNTPIVTRENILTPTPTSTATPTQISFTPTERISVQNFERLRVWRVLAMGRGSAGFSPDGKWLATANESGLHFWDYYKGSEVRTLGKPSNADQWGDLQRMPNGEFFFSPDAQKVIFAGAVFDMITGEQVQVLTDDCSGWLFSKNGDYAVCMTNQRVHIWNAITWKEERTLEIGADVRSFVLSDDGNSIFVALEPTGDQLWNVRSGHKIYQSRDLDRFGFTREILSVWPLFFEPDGQTVWMIDGHDRYLRTWNLSEPDVHGQWKGENLEIHGDFTMASIGSSTLIYDEGGKTTSVIACLGGNLFCADPVWKYVDLKIESPLFSPDGYFLAGRKGSTIEIWAIAPDAVAANTDLAVVATPKPQATPVKDCTNGWSQLTINSFAVVAGKETDLPNRVRSGSSAGDEIIAQLYPGTIVKVLEGPVCADGFVFWRVDSKNIPTGSGWTAEGKLQEYWLEPYKP